MGVLLDGTAAVAIPESPLPCQIRPCQSEFSKMKLMAEGGGGEAVLMVLVVEGTMQGQCQ